MKQNMSESTNGAKISQRNTGLKKEEEENRIHQVFSHAFKKDHSTSETNLMQRSNLLADAGYDKFETSGQLHP